MSRGTVLLVASGQGPLPAAMARRALAGLGSGPRVAVSYAAAGGRARGFMSRHVAALFPGAALEAIEEDPRVVERADLVFVSGGDPVAGAGVLRRTGAGAWLRAARERGAPLMGVSAGAILLGDWWVDWPGGDDAPAELVPCAGVVAGHVFDAHDEADDWQELRAAAALLERRRIPGRCLGIPTGGALIFDGSDRMEVAGSAPLSLSYHCG